MGALMAEYESVRRRRGRVALLAAAAVPAGIGAWLTAPFGIVQLVAGEPVGWALVAAGAVLIAACVVAVVAAVRSRVAPASLPGKANARFDEPERIDPRPGNAWIDHGIGSH